ncbi:hypothetical protein SNE40_014333 [Patella caerulea]|uniref:Uncharacterized protein n=1 Tax=Patella caerulea TaxID=87958 RepID=A0AAN8PQA9_PATCE
MMKKLKRRLSLTLRPGRTIDESLSELAEHLTVEDRSQSVQEVRENGIVHEIPRIGSDGESEEVSGTSDEKDDNISPVKRRNKNRRINEVRSPTQLTCCIK